MQTMNLLPACPGDHMLAAVGVVGASGDLSFWLYLPSA